MYVIWRIGCWNTANTQLLITIITKAAGSSHLIFVMDLVA